MFDILKTDGEFGHFKLRNGGNVRFVPYVVVNMISMGEFKVQRGLRQGGKFVHFFFNIEAEGLCGMMKQVIEKKLYASYLAGKLKIEVNLL